MHAGEVRGKPSKVVVVLSGTAGRVAEGDAYRRSGRRPAITASMQCIPTPSATPSASPCTFPLERHTKYHPEFLPQVPPQVPPSHTAPDTSNILRDKLTLEVANSPAD